MRTKLSKRILSVLLAALMVVTSLPLIAFAAGTDAVTDPDVIAAQDAMEAFGDKLAAEGAAYGNVGPAYTAYVNVQKAIDSYYYGTADVSTLRNAVSALETASNKMTTFSGYSVDNSALSNNVWAGDSSANYGDYYKNVLWINNGYNPTFENFMTYSDCDMVMQSGTSVTTALAYPEAVLLYDGVNTPATSVMAVMQGDGQNVSNADRYVFAIAVTSGNGLDLLQNWKSNDGGTFDHIWNMNNDKIFVSKLNTGFNGASADMIADGGWFSTDRFTHRYSNMFTFTGTMDKNEYVRNINPTVTSYSGSNTSFTNDDIVQAVTGTRQIHVLNATALTSALQENGNKMKSIDLANYSEGGLTDYITAMDNLAGFDFNSYFDNGNNYNQCATDMKNAVTAANNASTTNNDSDQYANLRSAMDAKMAAYNDGVNQGYTEDSYSDLVAAYENAMNVMNAVSSAGYADSQGAQEAADLLNAVELVTDVDKVDTTALEAAIDAFEAYTNIFTAETYAQAEQAVDTAKTTVWGSVDRYKDEASALDDSEENIATVAAQLAAVENAVKALRINPDAAVITEYGRYSINSAIALDAAIEDKTAYYNYATFKTALDAANAYVTQIGATDFTDFNTQYADYVSHIETLVEAYNALEYSFTRIPDGTVAKAGSMYVMTQLSSEDQGFQHIDFSYPTGTVLFKTSHGQSTLKYGDINVTFSTNIANLDNNSLDSISINATASDIGGQRHINTTFPTASSTPNALSDSEKQTYAGCLAYNEFSISNLKLAGMNSNVASRYVTLSDGTVISDEYTALNTDLTSILGTTDGASANPASGAVFAKSSSGDNLAEVFITGDMNVTVPGTPAKELSASTVPTTYAYALTGTYFGAVSTWNCQNLFNYSGYNWFTTQANNQQINSSVQVIDISYLVDLVNTCNALLDDSAMYTDSSFAAFSSALEAAQENLPYASLTQATILNRCKTRYTNLWNAYQNLEIKTLPVTFNFKAADGTDDSAVINVQYGKTLNDYAAEINEIDYPETYVSTDGAYTYTFIDWSPAVDLDSPVTAAITYEATYEGKLNKANFTEYNNAVAQLLGALVDETYTVADLEAVKAAIDAMTYYDMPQEDRDKLMGDVQASINEETAKLNELRTNLTPAEIDADAAKAAAESAKAGRDEDVYDLSTLDFTYTSVVNVGGEEVIGLTFGTQDELDKAISEFLNGLSKNVYTVYFNGEPVGTAEYDTAVIIGSDGTFNANVADLDSDAYDGEDMVAWSYSYSAPSRDNVPTDAKYMLTAKSIGFVVKGDTYLTTELAVSDGEGYVVTFMTNDGKVFDVRYVTDGTVTIPEAPNYAFYNFEGYEGGYTANQEIDVTGDMTIVADYVADQSDTFTITSYSSLADWTAATNQTINSYSYNERVDLTSDDAYCWLMAYTEGPDYVYEYTLLAYGKDYSFYACRAFEDNVDADTYAGIVAVTKSDYEALLEDDTQFVYDGAGNRIQATYDIDTGSPIYPNTATVSVMDNVVPIYDSEGKFQKFSMIGTFTLPDDYTIAECGILFSSNQAADLTVDNVGNDGVARMKSSAYTCGNQFAINVKAPSSGEAVSFKYCAYAVVENAEGELVTLYSTSVLGSTEGF